MRDIINPFSKKAKQIVKNAPPIHELPEDVFELARDKVVWKKTDKRPPKGLLELESKKDVLSYHLLFLSAGLNFSGYSNEVRLVKDVVCEITKGRLLEAYKIEGENFRWRFEDKFAAEEVPGVGLQKPGYRVSWKSLLPLISSRELRLSDWDVSDGWVYSNRVKMHKDRNLGPGDLIEMYSRLVACEAADYMSSLFGSEQASNDVSSYLKGIVDVLREVSEESYKAAFASGKSQKFAPENFPPCIQGVLRGVSSGSRNYAISVLLTSFLSYARAAPEKVDNPRIVDFIKDPGILSDEIMPLIYRAAEMCNPPLFEDQPLEKMNVSYHLGLGLTEDVKLENSGTSKWYFPPNCEKVRREAPGLCKPDKLCERIKNPINYYFIKMKDTEEDETGAEDIKPPS
jgi:DNA primase large subunit